MKTTILGIGLLGIAAIMMVPAFSDSVGPNGFAMWGMAEVIVYDADGNEVLRNTVHNRVMDEGEDFLVKQVFKDGSVPEAADIDQIGSICLSKHITFNGFTPTGATETQGANTFDTNSGLATELNCKDDAAVDVSGNGIAVIVETLTYTANLANAGSHIITNIGICQADNTAPASDFDDCEGAQSTPNGILFAQIDIVDFTMQASGEQATITYTFNISADDTP